MGHAHKNEDAGNSVGTSAMQRKNSRPAPVWSLSPQRLVQ